MDKNMDKKILFVDLDGTLLNDKKEVTAENMDAMKKAGSMGHAIVVTTGRPLCSAVKQIRKLGLTYEGCYAITSNGALIYDSFKEETIYLTGVAKDCVREAFDEAYKFGIHPQTYSDTCVVCEQDNECIQFYANSTLAPYEVHENVMDTLENDPIKILFIDLHDKSKLERFREHMEGWSKEHDIDMFFSCDQYLEFLPKGVNKGSGIRFLSDYLNIPYENTIGAGDAENDITMLTAVALPCVMKNAHSDMYAYGKYITKRDNNNSGVAEIIEKFML